MAILAVAAAGAAIGGGIAYAAGVGVGLGLSVGWAIGSYIGQMLFAPDQLFEGPRLSDLQTQASTDGAPLPLAYGTVRLAGKIIWATNIIETRHEEDVGGKGGFGSSQTAVTYTYSVNMAVSLCEGPTVGIRRIWMDGKLVFSIATGADPATFAANTAHGTITSYLGTTTQTADATIASYVGAGLTPGYRKTAYLVFANWQLADFANHIPMVEAEIVVSGAKTFPSYFFQLGSPTESTQIHALDTRRTKQYSVNHVLNAGDHVWKWDLNSTTAEQLFEFDTFLATFLSDLSGMAIDERENQILLFTEKLNAFRYARIDIASGALIDYAQIALASESLTGTAEGVNTRDMWFYDYQQNLFVTLGDGFSTSDRYVISFTPKTRAYTAIPIYETSTIAWNKSPLIDAQGKVWFVDGALLIQADASPIAYELPVASTQDGSFIWAARGEIWMPRSSGHTTDGWIVFDLTALTFSNSVDLFGTNTWTTDYVYGVENTIGYAWFFAISAGNDLTADQRDTNGTQTKYSSGELQMSQLTFSIQYIPGVVIFYQESGYLGAFYEDALAPGTADLADVATDLCSRVGLSAIDATELVGEGVRGFVVARPMSARNALEPLQMAFSFDGVESDALIRFVKRGGASVVTIPQDDMAARAGEIDQEPTESLVRMRALETEMPATIHMRYINQTTDYNIAAETARRLTTQAKNTLETELPIVLTSQEAAQLVDIIMRQAWLERERYSFFLGPKYSYLDPTDVVTLYDGSRVRLTRISQDVNGILSCEASGDDDSALTSYRTGSVDEWTGAITIPATSPTVLEVIDGALLRDRDDDVGRYLAMCGEFSGWTAGVAYQSRDGGVSWSGIAALGTASKIGHVVGGLLRDAADPGLWDQGSEITVRLSQPDLTLSAPASMTSFYEGANAFYISRDRENWELAQAYTVTSNSDGTYTLRDFLRARKGTEHSAGPFLPGAVVVFVDSTRTFRASASLTELGGDYLWKGVTTRGNITDEVAQTRTFDGISAKPLAPVEIGGARQAVSGDIVIKWTRRARKDADWRSGGAAPLDEPREEYEVEIWTEGYGTLLRTIEVQDTNTTTYTADLIATDFGSPQPEYVSVKVYQLSDRIGRGFPGMARVGNRPAPARFSETLVTDNMTIPDGYGMRRVYRANVAAADFAPMNRTFTGGKWYWEDYVSAPVNISDYHGGITNRGTFATGGGIGSTDMRLWRGTGAFTSHPSIAGTDLDYAPQGTVNTFMYAWDAETGEIWAGLNGLWTEGTDPVTGVNPNSTHTAGDAWRPIVVSQVTGYEFTVDSSFGRGNRYPIPSGFTLID